MHYPTWKAPNKIEFEVRPVCYVETDGSNKVVGFALLPPGNDPDVHTATLEGAVHDVYWGYPTSTGVNGRWYLPQEVMDAASQCARFEITLDPPPGPKPKPPTPVPATVHVTTRSGGKANNVSGPLAFKLARLLLAHLHPALADEFSGEFHGELQDDAPSPWTPDADRKAAFHKFFCRVQWYTKFAGVEEFACVTREDLADAAVRLTLDSGDSEFNLVFQPDLLYAEATWSWTTEDENKETLAAVLEAERIVLNYND